MKKRYFGCQLTQRVDSKTTPVFVFYARASEIIDWADIRRSEDNPKGIQRVLRPSREKSITRFLESNPINIIPSNILLAFGPGKAQFKSIDKKLKLCLPSTQVENGCNNQLSWGVLSFSYNEKDEKPALVVDGQHRLFGISKYQAEDLPILVVCLLDAPLEEQAFQFIVVNNKAVRVQTDNVKSIIAELVDETTLEQRLLKAGVKYGEKTPLLSEVNDSPTSPFRNLLAWDYNRDGPKVVPLMAIEQSAKFIRDIFKRYLEDDDDSLVEIFFAIWRGVRASYPDLWGQKGNLMTKVAINALNEFIVDKVKVLHEMGFLNVFDTEELEKRVFTLLKQIPQEFWQAKWLIPAQDNSSFRELIIEELGTLQDNLKLGRRWNEDLQLV